MTQTILHCINSFSSRGGGVSFALRALCDTLEGFNHIILTLRDDQPVLDTAQAEVQVFERTGPFSLSYSRGLEAAMRSQMRGRPEAVLHVHGMWSGLGWSAEALRRQMPALRYVVSPHGMLSPAALGRRRIVKAIMRGAWETALLKNAQAVHCLTGVEARHALGFEPGLRTVVQPHAVDFPLDDADLADGWAKGRGGRKTLLYLGRIHETKGVTELVAALDARARAGRPCRFALHIAGMGAPQAIAALKAQIAASLAEVTFLGPVFGAEKTALLQAVQGLILPSQTEGLPMTLMEGAALGLPLFITQECNLDWVGPEKAGLSVPYGAAGIEALIEAFDRLPGPDLARMGLRAAVAARKRYSPEVVSAGWHDLYTHARP